MVRLALKTVFALEGVVTLQAGDPLHHVYMLRLRCSQCQTEYPSPVTVTRAESHAMPKSRGEAHLVIRCKFCHKDASIVLEPASLAQHYSSQDSDAGRAVSMLVLDCRGVEPTAFIPGDGWIAHTDRQTVFSVDLSDQGEFFDYDEQSQQPVSVHFVSASFDVVR